MKPFDQWADELADHVRAKNAIKKAIKKGTNRVPFFLCTPDIATSLTDGSNTYLWKPDVRPVDTKLWNLHKNLNGPFPIGSLVKLVAAKTTPMMTMSAEAGAIAWVVGYDMQYVYVIWSRDDKSKSQSHGAYSADRFEQVWDFS